MAILVTGVGYIGAQLVTDLLARGEEVVAIDNFFSTDRAAVERLTAHPNCRLVRGHFGDRRVLAEAFRHRSITQAYCLAGQASAHPDAASARYTESSNLLAPRQLLDAMRRHGVRSIVYASSLQVYKRLDPSIAEEEVYGTFGDLSHLSKCYVEKLLEMYASLYGLRCVAARLGLVYGLSPVMKRDYRFMTAPNKFCLQLARGEAIVLHPGSEKINGFVHVADASGALRAIAAFRPFEGYTAITMATEWTSVASVAQIVRSLAHRRKLYPDSAAVEPPPLASTGSRLASTGFRPSHSLVCDLDAVLDYFRDREAVEAVPQAVGTKVKP